MKKKIISLLLALTLSVAMALPASAACVAMARNWNDFYYATNDACYTNRFVCTIESDSTQYTLATDVATYKRNDTGKIVYYTTYYCAPAAMAQQNNRTVDYAIAYIYAHHKVGTATPSSQQVWAT